MTTNTTTITTDVEYLDPRWVSLPFGGWHWHESFGVFDYVLFRDETTKTYTLVIDRVDAGRRQTFGPFVNHTTATDRVIKHMAGK